MRFNDFGFSFTPPRPSVVPAAVAPAAAAAPAPATTGVVGRAALLNLGPTLDFEPNVGSAMVSVDAIKAELQRISTTLRATVRPEIVQPFLDLIGKWASTESLVNSAGACRIKDGGQTLTEYWVSYGKDLVQEGTTFITDLRGAVCGANYAQVADMLKPGVAAALRKQIVSQVS